MMRDAKLARNTWSTRQARWILERFPAVTGAVSALIVVVWVWGGLTATQPIRGTSVGVGVGIVSVGLALLLHRVAARIAVALAWGGAAIGLWLGIGWATGSGLGLELLLGELGVPPGTTGSGQVELDVAVGLAAAGIAMAIASRFPVAGLVLGSIVWSLGGIAAFGHAAGIEPGLGWGRFSGMAPHVALSLLAMGCGILVHASSLSPRVLVGWRGPLVGGVTVAIITVLLWDALRVRQQQALYLSVSSAARAAARDVESRVEARLQVLRVMAREWGVRGAPTPDTWDADARLVAEAFDSVLSLQWIEASENVHWTYLVADSEEDQPAPTPREAGDGGASLEMRAGMWTERPCLEISVPVYKNGEHRGFLYGFFAAQKMLGVFLDDAVPNFHVVVRSADDLTLYERDSGDRSNVSKRIELRLPDRDPWALEVTAERSEVEAHLVFLPWACLVLGLLLAALLFWVLRLLQRWNRELLHQTGAVAASVGTVQRVERFLSHELRQPLGALRLWVDMLVRSHRHELDDRGRSYLDEIASNTTRLHELVEGVLCVAAATAHKVRFEEGELADVARKAVDSLAEDLRDNRGKIIIDSLPRLRMSATHVEQMLRNLIENAIKYRGEDPPEIRVEAERSNHGWNIRVSDNGVGFPAEHAERIFELGERLLPNSKGGLGVGLAIVRRVAELHGGKASATAEPGEGAVFTVWLPDDPVPRLTEAAKDETGAASLTPVRAS